MELIQETLKKLLHYEPETGRWTWLVTKTNSTPAGSLAGAKRLDNYIHIRIDGKFYYAHRLAWFYMTGEWPKAHIDHLDGNPSDNRWANLREATRSQNLANARKPKTNTSGFKGVFWHNAGQRWCSQITAEGKHIHLGLFSSKEDAHKAYAEAAIRYHGEFARVG